MGLDQYNLCLYFVTLTNKAIEIGQFHCDEEKQCRIGFTKYIDNILLSSVPIERYYYGHLGKFCHTK